MSAAKHDPRIEARLAEAGRWFRAHQAHVTPDAAFATRVTARLRRDAAEDLGRVALRWLPATVALALVLAWFAAARPEAKRSPQSDLDVVGSVYGEAVATQ
jgi:hypothetical protein